MSVYIQYKEQKNPCVKTLADKKQLRKTWESVLQDCYKPQFIKTTTSI